MEGSSFKRDMLVKKEPSGKTDDMKLNLSGYDRYKQKPMSMQQERLGNLQSLVKFNKGLRKPKEYLLQNAPKTHQVYKYSKDEYKSEEQKLLSVKKVSMDSKNNPNLTNSQDSKFESNTIRYSMYSSKSRDKLELGDKYD